uniref:Putative ovule protein n=1 Tax=Solanum chacoense TaxID=4108 RepID=A0A0V0HJF1_SOLCH
MPWLQNHQLNTQEGNCPAEIRVRFKAIFFQPGYWNIPINASLLLTVKEEKKTCQTHILTKRQLYG